MSNCTHTEEEHFKPMNRKEQSQNLADKCKNTPDRKLMIKWLSTDAFLSLSRTLRAYLDFTSYLLDAKKFKFTLLGFSNNDRAIK